MNVKPDFGECILTNLSIHRIGNKALDDPSEFSLEAVPIEDNSIRSILMNYFVKPVQKAEHYTFHHSFDLAQNEIYHLASIMLNDISKHQECSIKIGQHLFESSTYPNIKPGELYVVRFESIFLGDEIVSGIGIFKSESKDTYIRVYPKGKSYAIESEQGINVNKLDKGALILNTDQENGYIVAIVDHTNRGQEAKYWTEDFLGVKPREDNYHFTRNLIKLSKDFAEEALSGFDRADQVDLMNRSVEYLSENERYNRREYEEKVLQDPELIESYEAFSQEYIERNHLPEFQDDFEVSKPGLKSAKRFIKSVIKLDKDFHVYVHGSSDKIEKGFDPEKGMNYYKIYFNQES